MISFTIRWPRLARIVAVGTVVFVMAPECGPDPDICESPVLSIVPSTDTVLVGDSKTVAVVSLDRCPYVRTISWQSLSPSIAAPTPTSDQIATVRGVAPGTAMIKATYQRAAATMTIVVLPVPTSLTVTPRTSTVTVGQAATVTATVSDAQGNPLTIPYFAPTWTSGSPTVSIARSGDFTVSATGVSIGTSTITASYKGLLATAQVTVVAPVQNTLTITPLSASLLVGGSTTLTATVRDPAGNIVAAPISWQSANSGIAAVTPSQPVGTATVTGVAAGGPVAITATSGSLTASSQITVAAPPSSRLAYALADQRSMSSYTVIPTKGFNSTGAPVRVRRFTDGSYIVSFDGLQTQSVRKEAVLVTSVGTELQQEFNVCRSAGSANTATSLEVSVLCTDSGPDPADQEFAILVLGDDALTGRFAFTLADNPTTASYTAPTSSTFTSSGQPVTITHRSGAGLYTVSFPGLDRVAATDREALIVSAVGTQDERCGASALAANSVDIKCTAVDGKGVDSKFSLALIGNDPTHVLGIARTTTPAGISQTSTFSKSGGAISVSRVAIGRTDITFTGLGPLVGTSAINVQLVGSNTSGECKLTKSAWQTVGADVVVHVQCYDSEEDPADLAYTVVIVK